MTWHKWVGKPHVTGDDPTTDPGCDCLLMVVRARQALGLPTPSLPQARNLIRLAQAGEHEAIQQWLAPHLIEATSPDEGFFTIFESAEQIGTAVMIGGGLLHVSHKRGVRWLPPSFITKFSWYDWA